MMPPPPRIFTPLPPQQFTPPPPLCAQLFPEPSFRSWLADNDKRKELIDELKTTAPPIASQLDVYAKLKHLQSQMMTTRLDIINLKKQMREEAQREAQRRERRIDQFGESLQRQQLLFYDFTSSLLASISCNELRLNAPAFFHKNTGNHCIDEGTHPLTLNEFRIKAQD